MLIATCLTKTCINFVNRCPCSIVDKSYIHIVSQKINITKIGIKIRKTFTYKSFWKDFRYI